MAIIISDSKFDNGVVFRFKFIKLIMVSAFSSKNGIFLVFCNYKS